jgi:isoleucyl-tRNA synthetase
MKYGLDNFAPVDDDGKFTREVPEFAGTFVFDANGPINRRLAKLGALLGQIDIQHTYPHCWRCKQPIIFRSTEQWFISMEKNDLRRKALKAIDTVNWIPAWGHDRIFGMIENRPDWCISRQRLWGVPITMFYCKECGAELMTETILAHVVGLVRDHGADVWFERDAKGLLPAGTCCPKCGAAEFRKETNILDVWFDSGVSHAAVLEHRPDLSTPADMYLEGNDQHRGWFHSSLLESIGTRGRAPYRNVLTHGFVVDGDGKKMSKSVGNVIDSQTIIDQYGAEILRLWVAAEDYTEDIRISEEILKRLVEAYRRIRNTSRFILGNLYDFNPATDRVPDTELLEMDRWILHRLQEVIRRVRDAYEAYQFHLVYTTLYNFCTVDLSALYLDVLKDRLYTSKAGSPARRSAQTAITEVLAAMVRLLAPILTFTAEEVWLALPTWPGKPESVHLAQFPEVDAARLQPELAESWKTLVAVKGEVAKAIEAARKDRTVGHPLDASVVITAPEKLRPLLQAHCEDLRALLIVSAVRIEETPAVGGVFASEEMPGLSIAVTRAQGEKCNRCWMYSQTIGSCGAHPTLCARCVENL